eukprot:349957-Pelagomonas_calceolata.AAC.2
MQCACQRMWTSVYWLAFALKGMRITRHHNASSFQSRNLNCKASDRLLEALVNPPRSPIRRRARVAVASSGARPTADRGSERIRPTRLGASSNACTKASVPT